MRVPRIALSLAVLALTAAAAAAPSQSAPSRTDANDRSGAALKAPAGLKGFLLRYDEAPRHVFPSEPAFAWQPTPNTSHYEFQLATSTSFRDNSIIYENNHLSSPSAAIPVTLPWASGNPYAFFARVRAITEDGATPWSNDFGFNTRWPNIPTPLPAPDGLLRWTPVAGAAAYQVWEMGITGTGANSSWHKWVLTTTNVIDQRDWYTFKASSADSTWYKTIRWRVRALRVGSRIPTKNDTPRSFAGPWSPVYTNVNTPRSTSPSKLGLGQTVSDVVGSPSAPVPHGLMPGFSWSGNQSLYGEKSELYRVYVFSDQDCLNPVYIGGIVGSPAYAPRINGTLALPATSADLTSARTTVLSDGAEGFTSTADNDTVVASESLDPNKAQVDPMDPRNAKLEIETDPNIPTAPVEATSTIDPSQLSTESKWVDLWDRNWPGSGYYWTVIPVTAATSQPFTTTLAGSSAVGATTITVSAGGFEIGDTLIVGSGLLSQENATVATVSAGTITLTAALTRTHAAGEIVARASTIGYEETELWQDACAAGRVARFGKISQPVVTGGTSKAYISGLTPTGKVQAASATARSFYGVPVIAWQPALGADEYEIQWSQKAYPFVPALTKIAVGTTTMMSSGGLGFKPGTYYYRVRGINLQLPKTARALGWSKVQKVTIAAPTFKVTS